MKKDRNLEDNSRPMNFAEHLLPDIRWVRGHSFEAYLPLATIQNGAEA
jgi:hypothetical protein